MMMNSSAQAKRTCPKKTDQDPSAARPHVAIDKPLLLLHVCCGPCASHVIDRVRDTYHPVGFFFNPNLYPKQEYHRRLEAAARVARRSAVALWVPPFKEEDWLDTVKGLETEPEGGRRCEVCIQHRLEMTAWMAEAASADAFATTLSLGPMKKSYVINKIGTELSKSYRCRFLAADFKKENGFLKSVQMSKEMGLYRQNYCGCRYSMRR